MQGWVLQWAHWPVSLLWPGHTNNNKKGSLPSEFAASHSSHSSHSVPHSSPPPLLLLLLLLHSHSHLLPTLQTLHSSAVQTAMKEAKEAKIDRSEQRWVQCYCTPLLTVPVPLIPPNDLISVSAQPFVCIGSENWATSKNSSVNSPLSQTSPSPSLSSPSSPD
jgi:hypothetical protein